MAKRLTKNDIISNVYYDVNEGFGSVQETLKKAKEKTHQSIQYIDVLHHRRPQTVCVFQNRN